MAPRKSRSANKRFSYVNEVSSRKTGENANKSSQKKRKISDMLGPQWSQQELERFYEAYRKHGEDWKKVATIVRNRSVEMVEALYTMNRAYLSLPDGAATVVGLIAMMTDHYCVLGGSDSDQQSNDSAGVSHKPKKRTRGQFQSNTSKGLDEHFEDASRSQSVVSSNGCLSLLKKRRSGIMPHAVRKRTPRVPVSYSDKDNRERKTPPSKQNLKHNMDASGDDVAHEIAMALTEASQKGGSPQVPQMSNRKVVGIHQNGLRRSAEAEKTSTRLCHGGLDKGGTELSLGSIEADKRNSNRGRQAAETVELQQRGKRYHINKLEVKYSVNELLDDIKEASSGTEEHNLTGANGRSIGKGLRKRSKKALFLRDEDSPFDALQTLADMSLMMPETTADPEPSVQEKGQNFDVVNKSKLKGTRTVLGVDDTGFTASKLGKAKEGTHQLNAGIQKRKQKSFPFKIYKNEGQIDSNLSDNQKTEAVVQVKKLASKGKRSSHSSPNLKQGNLVKPLELTSSSTQCKREETDSIVSTIQVHSANQPPTKIRSRWKKHIQEPLLKNDTKISENIFDDKSNLPTRSLNNRELNLKDRLGSCLSRYQAQRWCIFEWFYSSIDYPWFTKREFVEYLNHVGLGHVPRLTRVEWGVIRSSLGKPRRFSEHFLKEEREKLNQYRESVRRHFSELCAGTREGLPTDLARPLSVGQHVIAVHPKTRTIQDGSILAVDHSRCYVQFDQPELGVEYVMDIDCMPLNPLENLPASFTRQNFSADRLLENIKEIRINKQLKGGNRINEQLKEGKSNDHVKIALTDNQDNICKLSKHSEGTLSSSEIEAKVAHGEATKTEKVANSQLSVLALVQAKEADVQALFELTRALDKKEAVVFELKCMNDEVLENQKDGDNNLKDSEPFKKQYAAVALQLNEFNAQVSSALLSLRKRNTYQGGSQNMLMKPVANLNDPGAHSSSCVCSACYTLEPGPNVGEIVESSRMQARRMIHIAMQAMSSLKVMENNPERNKEAIELINKRLSEEDFALQASRPFTDSFAASLDQSTAGTSNALSTGYPPDPTSNSSSNQNETKLVSELIANCLATLLMIQKCTERQIPPADVARIIDSTVRSLQPLHSQNLPVYEDIQKCLGILKNQILALIPT